MTLKKIVSFCKSKNGTHINSQGLWYHAQDLHKSNKQSEIEHCDGGVHKMSHP